MSKITGLIAIPLCMLATMAKADVWAEREALAKVSSEISALERLVIDASHIHDQDGRVTFNYDRLMRDLEVIRLGIGEHLQRPINPVMPLDYQGLRGDYTSNNP